MADLSFQTTSRADDPQLHTHSIISAKVQTADGRWLALDARYLNQHQRMLGGLYQSVLRAELTHHWGVRWNPIVHGQAEIAGAPTELLTTRSKRAAVINTVLTRRLAEFETVAGRAPSRYERMAIEREVAADTRSAKSGHGVVDLVTRWRAEAAGLGWNASRYVGSLEQAAREATVEPGVLHVDDVIDALSADRSAWTRADVVQAICDRQPAVSHIGGHDWARAIETAADRVIDQLVDLDPTATADAQQRVSDGRWVWIAPTSARYTSELVLAQEEAVISWALLAQTNPPAPSTTVDTSQLDAGQADAAAAVAGDDRLVLVVGPAGAGKTRTLAAVEDLHAQGRVVIGVTPTAKAARVLAADTAMPVDTVAKLLYDWHHHHTLADHFDMPAGGTLIVDEAAMLSTPNLHDLIGIVEQRRWRLALVGDPRQLQAVGRGGLVAEVCANGRVHTLDRLHRFTHPWEAAASLMLRHGNPDALNHYDTHQRIHGGSLDQHRTVIADRWLTAHAAGKSIAVVASSNENVDLLNHTIQQARRAQGQLAGRGAPIAAGEHVHVGDVVMTRRNDRRLVTTTGEPVRNREIWTVTAIGDDGALTLLRRGGGDTIMLPVDYVREHVRLGYAATEHGYQADTVDSAIALAATTTTRRGLYVAMTRGRDRNDVCVVTDTTDPAEARDVLEQILAYDRADLPAVTVRHDLAAQQPRPQTVARCEIPHWFPAYVNEARDDLADIRQQIADADRAPARAARDVAWDRLNVVDEHTRPVRDTIEQARRRVDDYSHRHDQLAARLEHAGRRERRYLRRDLDDADRLTAAAGRRVDQLESSAAPELHAYTAAVNDYRAAEHRCSDEHRSSSCLVPLERLAGEKLDALTTWRDWATGQHVDSSILAAAFRSLAVLRTPQSLELARAMERDPRSIQPRQRPGPERLLAYDFGLSL